MIDNIEDEAFRQYETIRMSGLTNMFDLKKVTELAEDYDMTALLEAIDEGNYGRILRNYSKAVEYGVIERKT